MRVSTTAFVSAHRRALGAAACAAAVTTLALAPNVVRAATTPPSAPASPAEPANALPSLTAELTALAGEIHAHPEAARAPAGEVKRVAAERKQLLLKLFASHPELVASSLLADSVAATLQPIDPGDVEAKVTVSGGLTVIAGDGATVHLLTGAGHVPLTLFSNGVFPSVSQRDVSLSGYQLDTTVFIEAAGSSSSAMTTSSTTPTSGMVGTVNAAVIVTYFSDTTNPFSLPNIAAAFDGSPGNDVDSFFSQGSFGRTTLIPSFYGAFQLSMTQSTGCGGSLDTLAQASIAAAGNSIAYANVQRLIFVVDCPNLGEWATVGQPSVSTPQGTIQSGEAWIAQGSETRVYGYAHELGHNAGLNHADWMVCAPDVFVPPTNFGPDCSTPLYGDTFDTMGGEPWAWQDTPHYDAHHKYLAGWFSAANYPTVSAPGTYTYTLSPIESASSSAIALNIPRGDSGTSFTVEYRQPIGFDSWLSTCHDTCNVTRGASVKLVGGIANGADTHAIDMTPYSQPWASSLDAKDYYRDQALLPGMTFTDPEYGISITTESATSSGLAVQVTIPAQICTHTSPTVSVSPVSATVAPGQTATWALTVTNNYSPGCPPAAFRFRAYGVHGSNPYTDPGMISLASGASTTMTMSLPVATTLPYGTYTDQGYLAANALSDPGTTFNYAFTVSGPADATPPTPPQHLTATVNGAHLVTLNWLPSTDAVAVGGYQVYRDDTLVTTTSSTSFLDTSVAAGGSHTYRVTALNWAAVASAYSNGVAITTPSLRDTTPPADVPSFTATSIGAHRVDLSWRPATDDTGVAYYVVVWDNGTRTVLPPTSTRMSYGDLWSSTPATFYILAYDADGNASNFWDAVNGEVNQHTAASGTSAPLPPLSPQATTVTPGQVSLSWPPVTGATSYTVYRDSRPAAVVSGTSFSDSGVVAGATENYTVTAADVSGNVSGPSPELSVYMPSSTASGTSPTVLIASLATSLTGTVAVPVLASAPSGIRSVELLVDGVPSGSTTIAPFSIALNTTLIGNGPHSITATATAVDGDVGSSAVAAASVSNQDTTAPTTPVCLTATPGGATQVTLTWAASSDDVAVSAYNILRNGVRVASSATASYTDTGLSPSTSYSYQVQAVDAAANASALSTAASAGTFPADTQPPTAPTNLTAALLSATQIGLSWAPSTDNAGVAGYNVYRFTTFSGVFTLAGTAAGTSFTDGGLSAGVTYTYYVQAYDAAGNVSMASNQATGVQQTIDTKPPTAPANLTVSPSSTTQLGLSWSASTDDVGVAGYDIYRSSAAAPFAQVATVAGTSTSYTDGGLAAGTAYTYYVVAYDPAGNVSAASNQATATTAATVTPTGTLTGTVSASSGPIAGATVSLNVNGTKVTATTNGSGVYLLSGIPAGTYSVSYSARHYVTQIISLTLTAGTATQDVTLQKGR